MSQADENGDERVTDARILCPIRGGKKSAQTVDCAIQLALAEEAGLIFLYIVDVDFLGHATVARVQMMVDELIETGHFALSILCDKARDRGILEVESIIREGSIQEVIRTVIRETKASILVTGRPVHTPQIRSFTASGYQEFLKSLHADTGVRIEYVGEAQAISCT